MRCMKSFVSLLRAILSILLASRSVAGNRKINSSYGKILPSKNAGDIFFGS